MLDVPAEALFSAEEEHKAGDAVIAHFGRIVEEELHRTEEMIKRRMRTDGGVSPPSLQPCTPAGYEASIKVAATPEDALERLHQSIITDIRQEITGMRQVVRETLQETLAGKCKK
jgi:DnaJ-domain-containing protein 1